jgi:hypothetical protein
MRADVERRLAAVRAETEAARRMLVEIESQEVHLRKSLLRLSGAAQVLEELLAGDVAAAPPPHHAAANGAPRTAAAPPGQS